MGDPYVVKLTVALITIQTLLEWLQFLWGIEQCIIDQPGGCEVILLAENL